MKELDKESKEAFNEFLEFSQKNPIDFNTDIFEIMKFSIALQCLFQSWFEKWYKQGYDKGSEHINKLINQN